MSNEQLIRDRLAAWDEGDKHWNVWPSKAEIVSITVYDMTDPMKAFTLGGLIGHAKVMRQIYYSEFSYAKAGYDNEGDGASLVEVRQMMPRFRQRVNMNDQTLIHVDFILAGARGQEDDPVKRNILAIFPPHRHYNNVLQRMEFESHGLVVEIGCRHDYSDAGSNHQRGYHKGRCKRCGHTYMCDSGD
jgi:hypothetical protein